MGALGNYYTDGDNLSLSTAVYVDAGLSVLAPDGWYREGDIVREQSSGLLGIAQPCPSCGGSSLECGRGITASGTQGIYDIGFSTGSDYGCLIVYFQPNSQPDGLRVQFNAITYNEFVSPTEGYLASTVENNYTYIGATASDCGIASTLSSGGYTNQDEYLWNGTSFDLQGSTGAVTGGASDVQLTTTAPGYSTLFVAIPQNNTEDVNVQIFAPCGSNNFSVEVNCPVLLTGMSASSIQSSSDSTSTVCNNVSTYPNTLYNVPNRGGLAGTPAVNEFLVTDPYGFVKAAEGKYKVKANPPFINDPTVLTVDANGVITNVDICPIA